MVWDFTEYYYEGTNDPNYYYELQNTYSEKYLAPQIHSGGQLISNNPIGININGRRYNDYYSKILAWDDPNYDYAGFMVEDGQLKVVPMSKACEWYFAIPELNSEELTTIDTVDNDDYGISMKMKKYTGTIYGSANKLITVITVSMSWRRVKLCDFIRLYIFLSFLLPRGNLSLLHLSHVVVFQIDFIL